MIGAYGANHLPILKANLGALTASSKYEFDTVVMATEPLDIPGVRFAYFGSGLKTWFLWKHQDVLKESDLTAYDLIIFTEDDIWLTEDNLDYFREYADLFAGTEYLPGFLRYEVWTAGTYLVDMTLKSWDRGEPADIRNRRCWTTHSRNRMFPNVHQGVLMLDKERVRHLLDNGLLFVQPEQYEVEGVDAPLGPQESATIWPWKLYYRKAWALDELDRLLIEHCDTYRGYPVGVPLDEFRAHIQ